MGISNRKQTLLAPSFVALQPVGPSMLTTEMSDAYHDTIVSTLASRRTTLDAALNQLSARAAPLTYVATCLVETLCSGHKVLVAGNGGSAAQAQHFAGELVGRFKRERAPYAVLSLTTDTAILTAVANDYGYQDIFARQVLALAQPGDMLIAFSTSGESENLIRAAEAGQQAHVTTVAITGDLPSRLEQCSDITVKVPLTDTPLIQELHMIVTHILCDIVETQLSSLQDTLYDGTGSTRQTEDEWQR